MRSGSRYGNAFSKTAFTTLKMAVFAGGIWPSHGWDEAGVFEQLAEGEAEVRKKSLHGYQSVAWHSIFSQKDNNTLQTASSFLNGRGERNTSIPVRFAVGQYQRN